MAQTASEVIKDILWWRNVTYKKLADFMGLSGASSITRVLNNKHDMRVDTFLKYCNALGYEVVVKVKRKPPQGSRIKEMYIFNGEPLQEHRDAQDLFEGDSKNRAESKKDER